MLNEPTVHPENLSSARMMILPKNRRRSSRHFLQSVLVIMETIKYRRLSIAKDNAATRTARVTHLLFV
jgi:hypothetical protein